MNGSFDDVDGFVIVLKDFVYFDILEFIDFLYIYIKVGKYLYI